MNFGNDVAKIQQKYEREREKAKERKFWILAMASPKFLLPKPADWETNCGNAIAEVGEKKFYGNCGNVIAKNRRKKKNSGCRNHMWGIKKKKKKKYYVYNIFTLLVQIWILHLDYFFNPIIITCHLKFVVKIVCYYHFSKKKNMNGMELW